MKKQVHYADLEDMQKYIEGFNPNDYESCGGHTDPSVTEYVRNYYDEHLPVDVTAWLRVNEPNKNLIYAKSLGNQVCFVRDILCQLLSSTYKEWCDNPPLVISTHYSKSDRPLDFDYMGLFNPTEEISYLYCEGFPKEKVYGCYEQNHSMFTIEFCSDYNLYTFIFLLKNYLGIKKEN